jgi:glycosyltransferase involved in cell wall biosynthesis
MRQKQQLLLMIKIHYHSECTFFAGCENMLANFFNAEGFRQTHNVSFSYAYSKLYEQGLNRRVHLELPIYTFRFLTLTECNKLPKRIPLLIRRVFMAGLRLLLNVPLLMYQVFVLFRLFKKINPDILHINNGGYPAARSALAAAIAGKCAGVPKVLMVVNNMAVGYRNYSRWLDYPIDRLIVRCVDVFITASHAAGVRLQTVLKLPAHQLRTIHNGITLRDLTCTVTETKQRLGLGEFKGVIFGVVALLIPRKGHQVLLDAVLELTTNKKLLGHEFKILIEGSGPLHSLLVDFVTINNLTSWVKFVGDEANIVDFMSVLDVLILPSIQDEDFPNVILEAMALGKPIIASRLAGAPEQVVDGVTGLLVAPRNVTQLATAVYQLADEAGMRSSMGSAALARFNTHFTSPIALNNYNNLYEKLIEDER